MKKLIVAVLLVLAVAATAWARYKQIDYKCVSDCLAQGYQYGYCIRVCSY